MPTLICPSCGHPTPRRVDSVSDMAHVNYYRCESCQLVWTTPKGQPDKITFITPPKVVKPAPG